MTIYLTKSNNHQRNKKPHECGVSYQYIILYGYFLTVTFLLVNKPLVKPDTMMSMKST